MVQCSAAHVYAVCAVPSLQDHLGRTPLHYAASLGHVDCINAILGNYHCCRDYWEILPPNTPDTRLVDVRNTCGFTPLHHAVWAGSKEAIQVRHGAI